MTLRFKPEELKAYTAEVFASAGIPAKDSDMMADALVTTDMRGVHSHGVMRSAKYIDCIRAGGLNPCVEPEIIAESASHIKMNACGGLGIPASVKATEKLIEKARKAPIAIATVNHSDHYGAAGYYAMKCAENGLIGFSMSNTCPLVAVTGGASAAIGNNPFAYAAPAGKFRALLFDICMSVAASGKIQIASAEKRKIPFGWILDADGNPTDEPANIYNGGIMLPFGDHKGYGLAVMVELMTALLGGAGIMSEVKSWNTTPGTDADTGHCFMAVNPEFFGGLKAFETRAEQMITELKNSKKRPDVKEIYYPGELEFRKEKDAFENGVELSDASVNELKRAGDMTGIDFSKLKTTQG